MALNDIKFTKTNGGMGRTAASEDPISGLIMSIDEGDLEGYDFEGSGFEVIESDGYNLYVTKLKFFEQLTALGITKEMNAESAKFTDNENYAKFAAFNTIIYHVKEFFRMNRAGILYLMIRPDFSDIEGNDIKKLQYYAGGTIRQVGIFTSKIDNIESYQQACTGEVGNPGLEEKHQPLSVIVGICGGLDRMNLTNGSGTEEDPYVRELSSSGNSTTYSIGKFVGESLANSEAGMPNVSLLISCDLDEDLTMELGKYSRYSCVGTVLGAISKASVHESIAWVQKFPLDLKAPGFISDDKLSDVLNSNLELINDNRYIFVRTHVGAKSNYFNDSFTLTDETSDYAYIENVRTIDKACRGIRQNLLPYLNSPLHVDAATGYLRDYVIENLKTVAGKALEQMEQAGELSGYSVEIDPAQDVLATSYLNIIIKKVGVGVMRNVRIELGYTTKID